MADLGELGAPRITLEELKAKVLLERLDLVADGGAGDAEFGCRKPERTKPGGGFESGQSTQGWEITTGQVSSPDIQHAVYNILKRQVLSGSNANGGKFLVNYPHLSINKIEAFGLPANGAHSP
jgi:hypothetical protein